ncbi:MAG: tetrathionate reductase family octaheme c-type cytochrome [Anaerolineales bacterium]|nr:tetrathionate reductase family octaheme c-type cytochrome [Anaerolineales bacterium]
MRNFRYIWLFGLLGTFALIIVPVFVFLPKTAAPLDDPGSHVPVRSPGTDHSNLLSEPFETGPDVTRACLECHEDAAHAVSQTVHWTWEGEPVQLPGREQPVTIGKKNQINNYCIGIQGNETGCTACHAGYGWEDESFDFDQVENIDCLVCHESTGGYVKGKQGLPVEGVDLLAAARSVSYPTRENCGSCHFNGGGGNGVKHGDLDQSLNFPSASLDVHMGDLDFQCIDCHQTQDHQISGRSISVSVDDANQVHCTDCHSLDLHADERINGHLDTVACQTCHIPRGAREYPTKMEWDWSQAGEDRGDDPHTYLKIKGSFVYEDNFVPVYSWYNGTASRYLLGDGINPDEVTSINRPGGNIEDPEAMIWPFKIHTAWQIYDSVYNYLIQPKTVGEGGYWTEFDWDLAARLGSEETGLPYSGSYGFTQTEMFWPLTHMVAPAGDALQCVSCHGDAGRIDWEALGYHGDPIEWGGRTPDSP